MRKPPGLHVKQGLRRRSYGSSGSPSSTVYTAVNQKLEMTVEINLGMTLSFMIFAINRLNGCANNVPCLS